MQSEFSALIEELTPKLAATEKGLNESNWALMTNSSEENLKRAREAALNYSLLRSDAAVFAKLKEFKKSRLSFGDMPRRILEILYAEFALNQFLPEILEKISGLEAELKRLFTEFRPQVDGRTLSENDILKILEEEKNHKLRLAAWEAGKKIGPLAASKILALVKLRNEGAKKLGYKNYHQMRLVLEDINPEWMLKFFAEALKQTSYAHKTALSSICGALAQKFVLPTFGIGPQFWQDPFCQEDPLKSEGTDKLLAGKDVVALARDYYHRTGFGTEFDDIFSRSDLFERPGKNQHGFCEYMDREKDVRILANVRNNSYCLRIIFHEFGHGVDCKSISPQLHWILRAHAHIAAAEAVAMLFERIPTYPPYLRRVFGGSPENEKLYEEIARSKMRQRIIFSRFAAVMTYFESALYSSPEADLNELWWSLVSDIQGIKPPPRPDNAADWAAKIHFALAPAYYHNYLLGDIISEQLAGAIKQRVRGGFEDKMLAEFLKKKWSSLGASLKWNDLVTSATGKSINIIDWTRAFPPYQPL